MRLRIQHHDGREEVIELDASGTTRFGTRASADVQLVGDEVRSSHLGVLQRGGEWQAVAFKKVGKICVNGRMVRKRVLQAGDVIDVGDNRIEVLPEAGDQSTKKRRSAKRQRRRSREDTQEPSTHAGKSASAAGDEALDELPDLDELVDPDELLAPEEEIDDLLSIQDEDLTVAAPGDAGALTRGTGDATHRQLHEHSRWFGSSWFKVLAITLVVTPLVILIGVYWRQLPAAAERFETAEKYYQRGDFPNASEAYNVYLRYHRDDIRADEAIVKQYLATLLSDLDRGVDADSLLTRLELSLTQWGDSASCAYTQHGLAELLPSLVADLTRQTRVRIQQGAEPAARDSLQRAESALGLMYRHLPRHMQDECGVEQLQLHFTRLQRELEQPEVLRAALRKIDATAESGGIQVAYTVRSQLLSEFPHLSTDGRLLAAMRALGRDEATRVGTLSEVSAAGASADSLWRAVPMDFGDHPEPADSVIALPERGTVYGVSTKGGLVVWRRYVGSGAVQSPSIVAGNGAVVHDGVAGELCLVSLENGDVQWRRSIPAVVGTVATDRGQLIVSSREGSMYAINAIDGGFQSGLALPLALPVGPVLDPTAPRVYQVAEHSLVYVLALDQSRCISTCYLGHEFGSVAHQPVVLRDLLLVCEQVGPKQSVLHVLKCGNQLEPVQAVSVPTAVAGPLMVVGDHVCVTGNDHRLHVFLHDRGSPNRPLQTRPVMQMPASDDMAGNEQYLAAVNSRLWVLGRGAASAELRGDSTMQLGPVVANHLINTRLARDADGGSWLVGYDASRKCHVVMRHEPENSEADMLITLAAEPVAAPFISRDRSRFWLMRSDGIVFEGTGKSETKLRLVARDVQSFGFTISGGDREAKGGFPSLQLDEESAWSPVQMGAHWVTAAWQGPLTLRGTEDSGKVLDHFMPEIIDGRLPTWSVPARVNDTQFLISDGLHRTYLMCIDTNEAKLRQVAATEDPVDITSRLAVVENAAWGVTAKHVLCHITFPNLAVRRHREMAGALCWGPYRVGEHVLVATDLGELVCLGDGPEITWRTQLSAGPVVGAAALDANHLIVATRDGVLMALDFESGSVVGSPVRVGQAISYGPNVIGEKLLLLTPDGHALVSRGLASNIFDVNATATAMSDVEQ